MTESIVVSPTIAREPILVAADILQSEMGLGPEQVMLAYEKWNIPPNPGLYIDLAYLGPSRIVSSINQFDAITNTEIQQVTMLHLIQIDLLSFDGSARARYPEVALALASIYAKQQAERYQMQFGRQPTAFIDASTLEETKRLNRFTTTVSATALHTKEKAAAYFDHFNVRPPLYTAALNPPEVHENV